MIPEALPLLMLALGAAQAVPEREMLDSFRAACARTGNDIEPMKADAAHSGWTAMAEDSEPRVARLVKLGREAASADGTSTGAAFRRRLGGRDIFLIVSRYEDKDGIWGVGCRLYDFEAAAPLESTPLEAWMGKPPTAVQVPAPGLSKRLWEPGWRTGISVEVSHVPQDHPLGKQYGLSGNILTAQAIGGF
jgi:hypothetical protein